MKKQWLDWIYSAGDSECNLVCIKQEIWFHRHPIWSGLMHTARMIRNTRNRNRNVTRRASTTRGQVFQQRKEFRPHEVIRLWFKTREIYHTPDLQLCTCFEHKLVWRRTTTWICLMMDPSGVDFRCSISLAASSEKSPHSYSIRKPSRKIARNKSQGDSTKNCRIN